LVIRQKILVRGLRLPGSGSVEGLFRDHDRRRLIRDYLVRLNWRLRLQKRRLREARWKGDSLIWMERGGCGCRGVEGVLSELNTCTRGSEK